MLVCDCPYMLVVMPAWLPAYLPVCLSCLALSCLVLSLRVFCLVLPYLVWSCRVRCLVLTCLVRFCPGLSFLSTCLSARCIFTNIACEVLTAAICYVPCLWTTRTLTQRVASKQVFRPPTANIARNTRLVNGNLSLYTLGMAVRAKTLPAPPQ